MKKKILSPLISIGSAVGVALAFKVLKNKRNSNIDILENTKKNLEQITVSEVKSERLSKLVSSGRNLRTDFLSDDYLNMYKKLMEKINDNRIKLENLDLTELNLNFDGVDPADVEKINEFILNLHNLIIFNGDNFIENVTEFFVRDLSGLAYNSINYLVCLKENILIYLNYIQYSLSEGHFNFLKDSLTSFIDRNLDAIQLNQDFDRILDTTSHMGIDSNILNSEPIRIEDETSSTVSNWVKIRSVDVDLADALNENQSNNSLVETITNIIAGSQSLESSADTEFFVLNSNEDNIDILSYIKQLYKNILNFSTEVLNNDILVLYSSERLTAIIILLCVVNITIGWVRLCLFLLNDRLLLYYEIEKKYPKIFKLLNWNRKINLFYLIILFIFMLSFYIMLFKLINVLW